MLQEPLIPKIFPDFQALIDRFLLIFYTFAAPLSSGALFLIKKGTYKQK